MFLVSYTALLKSYVAMVFDRQLLPSFWYFFLVHKEPCISGSLLPAPPTYSFNHYAIQALCRCSPGVQ